MVGLALRMVGLISACPNGRAELRAWNGNLTGKPIRRRLHSNAVPENTHDLPRRARKLPCSKILAYHLRKTSP
jgi:hypothetical protein